MDLMNRAIQYDRRCTEKPFLLDRHSLSACPPSFNAARTNAALQQIPSSPALRLDSGRLDVALGQVPHQMVTPDRYRYSARESCGAGEMRGVHRRDRVHIRAVDQHEPVARAGIGNPVFRERLRQHRIALDQMHRDDSVELSRIQLLPQCAPHLVFASRGRHTRYYSDWSSDVCSSDLEPRHGWKRRPTRPAASISAASASLLPPRSEERRVGKECRSRWSPYH